MRKTKPESVPRLAVIDTETRGLFGDIFRAAYFDGETYQVFNTGLELMSYILGKVKPGESWYIYGFNLEFDLSKILQEQVTRQRRWRKKEALVPVFALDLKNSLIIDASFHAAKIAGHPVEFLDLMPLVHCSLAEAAQSFELGGSKLGVPKQDGQSEHDYFSTVDPEDPQLNAYLRRDCELTYALLHRLLELSELPVHEFVRCPTTASLAMRIFKSKWPQEMEKIKGSTLFKAQEEFVRKAYYGGRTEIFRNQVEGGFHYDLNSLYPHVMEQQLYPVGEVNEIRQDGLTPQQKLDVFHTGRQLKVFYVVHATVEIPYQHIPPLPVRNKEGRLVFPYGRVTGYWCTPELDYALDHCGVELVEVHHYLWWYQGAPVFRGFVEHFRPIKQQAKGAKRLFAKLIQNSLYGKFATWRVRIQTEQYDPVKYDRIKGKGEPVAKLNSYLGPIMTFQKLLYADYIRPQYSVWVAAYARVTLLTALHALEQLGNHPVYCDTDSVVTPLPLPEDWVDGKAYGKWKLERKLARGLYVLPKLYAEVDLKGEEVLKSKGLIRPYRQTLTFEGYRSFFAAMIRCQPYVLYDERHGYFDRVKIMSAIKQGLELDTRRVLRKSFRFDVIFHKRIYCWQTNTSTPYHSSELELLERKGEAA